MHLIYNGSVVYFIEISEISSKLSEIYIKLRKIAGELKEIAT
ncbi:hypothetical protein MASR2M15_08550 [Anaerolineales bacterium]